MKLNSVGGITLYIKSKILKFAARLSAGAIVGVVSL